MIKKYYISKLSFEKDRNLIETISVYPSNGSHLQGIENQNRDWLVQKQNAGFSIDGISRNSKGEFIKYGSFSYDGSYFSWEKMLPKNLPKRNTFISYYHNDDEEKRSEFDDLFKDLIINQSVMPDDIDGDNSDDYIHQLINQGYMKDTTVLVVLLGPKTKCRKHIDWEIAGALNYKVGDRYSGLLGLRLPTHPDYGSGIYYDKKNYPERFIENVESDYAILADWTEDRKIFQDALELAFSKRSNSDKIVNKKIIMLTEDLCK